MLQGSPATLSLSMFQDRSYKRTFYSAPQSVTSLVAAVLEPTLIVLAYLGTALWFREPIMRPVFVKMSAVIAKKKDVASPATSPIKFMGIPFVF